MKKDRCHTKADVASHSYPLLLYVCTNDISKKFKQESKRKITQFRRWNLAVSSATTSLWTVSHAGGKSRWLCCSGRHVRPSQRRDASSPASDTHKSRELETRSAPWCGHCAQPRSVQYAESNIQELDLCAAHHACLTVLDAADLTVPSCDGQATQTDTNV